MIRFIVFTQTTLNVALNSLQDKFSRLSKDESGATAVEYALIVGLIAIVIIVAVTLLGTNISNLFSHAACVVGGKTWTASSNTCA